MQKKRGFTLVEMAIVLVIIGLILGAAFKGKDLIDSAKVKNMAAQVNKMQTAFNAYFDKYGAYPGDGCPGTGTAPALGNGVSNCVAGTRNGLLNDATEASDALILLQNTNMLTAADLNSVFGVPWQISVAGAASGNYAANTNYMQPGTGAVDLRFVCALDRLLDDGIPSSGVMRSSATAGAVTATGTSYDATSDCWQGATQVTMGVRILP
ncbi:type II secretion system protein [Deefgea piscis]|uniref:type II secretion system protein n=1 Tax=Deefgea piscis TaxID=2739061 RepID=UPI001C81DF3B|nr:prepilin-type N-terminal cleavage/methylation domain-containing protein [Deefgea piscis]QZA80537.1 prepilin-type N-terminal cleavage/methylation domain-containing protein [Deefgea piscis]